MFVATRYTALLYKLGRHAKLRFDHLLFNVSSRLELSLWHLQTVQFTRETVARPRYSLTELRPPTTVQGLIRNSGNMSITSHSSRWTLP
jgi:hypothetical protein